jgi:hypothetical protein
MRGNGKWSALGELAVPGGSRDKRYSGGANVAKLLEALLVGHQHLLLFVAS